MEYRYSSHTIYNKEVVRRMPRIKRRYWGKHFWARGYFCITVGQMTEEMVKNYLEHHFEANPRCQPWRANAKAGSPQ